MVATTPNRGYRFPQSSDGVQIYEWMQDLADDVDTDVAAMLVNYLTPTSDTSVGSAATNFSDNGSVARTLLGGHLVYVTLQIITANAIPSSSGAFGDITMFTLDEAYRPGESISAICGSTVTGEVLISSAGLVQIRSASDTIAAATNLRISTVFIKP